MEAVQDALKVKEAVNADINENGGREYKVTIETVCSIVGKYGGGALGSVAGIILCPNPGGLLLGGEAGSETGEYLGEKIGQTLGAWFKEEKKLPQNFDLPKSTVSVEDVLLSH